MVLWLSKRPGDVRDTWCVLQKARWCEGHLMRSPEDSGCEGPADTLLILLTNAHYYLSLIIFTLSHVLVHNDKDNNTRRNLTDVCNWPLIYPLPKSTLQKASTPIYRAKKRERYIETKIMFWEFEEGMSSHCSYTEKDQSYKGPIINISHNNIICHDHIW